MCLESPGTIMMISRVKDNGQISQLAPKNQQTRASLLTHHENAASK